MVGSLATLEYSRDGEDTQVHPGKVLEFQEQHADIAFTLDFPIPPGLDRETAQLRFEATIANAKWARENMRSRTVHLFGCLQGWDAPSYRACAIALADRGFDGLAIGGLGSRATDQDEVCRIVSAVREQYPGPIHVSGIGIPGLVDKLFSLGVQSVDSNAHVRLASEGRRWEDPDRLLANDSPIDHLSLAILNLAAATRTSLPLPVLSRLLSVLKKE
jgi:helicase